MKLTNRAVWLAVVVAMAPPVVSGATIEYDGGSRYEGDIVDGNPHGLGTMYRADDTIEHKGEWRDGEPHGWGRKYSLRGYPTYEGGMA